ncbi:MAG: RNA pseudouridine synthase [Treponema sp.]|jgi:23S rRNA pseudouridine1911/1915/1917 synthase|nr:RNA pseudouridine synthase [Treponema sp.]
MEDFWTAPCAVPRVAAETAGYLAVYKPPRMHTAPLREGEGGTLLAWAGERFPEVSAVPRGGGQKALEGGLLHRLDYETQGLVLIARTRETWENLAAQQKRGLFVKEYEAYSEGPEISLPGFGPFPGELFPGSPFRIESRFRPYGPGRKQVRPEAVAPGTDDGTRRAAEYVTEGKAVPFMEGRYFFLRIARGFRHQIRCHLAWARQPLVNDGLYGGKKTAGPEAFLALRASALEFTDPRSGERKRIILGT